MCNNDKTFAKLHNIYNNYCALCIHFILTVINILGTWLIFTYNNLDINSLLNK